MSDASTAAPPSTSDGIRCPICDGTTRVLETRSNGGSVRRRRACERADCDGRVTTVELAAPVPIKNATTIDLVVVPRRLIDTIRQLASELGKEML